MLRRDHPFEQELGIDVRDYAFRADDLAALERHARGVSVLDDDPSDRGASTQYGAARTALCCYRLGNRAHSSLGMAP